MDSGKYQEPDDIIIPVIEIVDGWAADSMETIEDCDDAHIKCMALIAEIEFQIDSHDARPRLEQDLYWLARAKRALKYKKLAAQIVNTCRSRIIKEAKDQSQSSIDTRLINALRAHVTPELFEKCKRIASIGDVDA